jgi:hypothetical protein
MFFSLTTQWVSRILLNGTQVIKTLKTIGVHILNICGSIMHIRGKYNVCQENVRGLLLYELHTQIVFLSKRK